MKTHTIPVHNFDLDHTLRCGQVFRWRDDKDNWIGIVGNSVIKAKQAGNRLIVESDLDIGHVTSYFRLNDDLDGIYQCINKDAMMNEAIAMYRGMRIIKQDPWECLISYICSRQNRIEKIERTVFHLSKNFGDEIHFDNKIFYTFPKPDELAKASLDDLRKCQFRFGDKQAEEIKGIAQLVSEGGFCLERLRELDYESAKEELMSLEGVGHKVADCVLLFSLDELEAFPVDVHVRRIVQRDYFRNNKISDKKLREWAGRYFGKYAGYAQQYLFYYERTKEMQR
ncbi:MAG: DNA glycosylase [Methanocellales archaeon]|nr:DNA glycosylase [Methanocellales archaeon]MDD3291625.1 DNA glycosylase [Methanocellales archaeon]MDD5235194.1 DNA glycosylase [Methanocellales archaeon]MDD5485408.1 DNA glycosylase [Methanocellales archaeon]